MRKTCPNSTGSSIFDRYSQELNDSRFSLISENSLLGFDKSIKKLNNIDSIASVRDKNNLFFSDLNQSTSYSHYEPVNNILQYLHRKKVTLNNLKQNSNDSLNNTVDSYCQYWGLEDENYQVINMLEPDLIRIQTDIYQFYQAIKQVNFEIKIISNHFIPIILNFESVELNNIDKNKIFKSFQVLSNLFDSLYKNISYIVENKIVVNETIIFSIVNQEFEKIYNAMDSFICGIIILFDIYDNSKRMFNYLITNGELILKQNGLIKKNFDCSNMFPHILLTKYKFKLFMFDSILPFELNKSRLSTTIDYCNQIKIKIENEKNNFYQQIVRNQRKEWIKSNSLYLLKNIPKNLLSICLYLPFILICSLIFTFKSICIPSKPKY